MTDPTPTFNDGTSTAPQDSAPASTDPVAAPVDNAEGVANAAQEVPPVNVPDTQEKPQEDSTPAEQPKKKSIHDFFETLDDDGKAWFQELSRLTGHAIPAKPDSAS